MWPSEFQLEQLYRAPSPSPNPADDFVANIKKSPFASRLSSAEKWIVARQEEKPRDAFEKIIAKYLKQFVYKHLNYATFKCHDKDKFVMILKTILSKQKYLFKLKRQTSLQRKKPILSCKSDARRCSTSAAPRLGT